MAKLRKNWRDYDITGADEEVKADGYVLFEEYHGQYYDTCKGIFSNLEVAKEYGEAIHETDSAEPLYVAKYSDWTEGNYDYLYEIK